MGLLQRPRWIAIVALAVLAAAGFALFRWRARVHRPRPVIVIGLDGADWQLLDRYRAAGVMPELDRLVREGRSGVLHSLVPPLSPLVWTTIATGVSPLQHRILDFTRFHPATGQREPITSDERRAKAVWEMASESGRDVAVFGLWATHPAEPVRGLVVSDRLFSFQRPEQAPAGAVSPAAEEERVRAARAAVESETGAAEVQKYLPWLAAPEYTTLAARSDPFAHPATALRRILVETRLYHRLALDWLRRSRPALTFAYFQGTDMIGHVFAPYAPPRQPAIPEADFERYQGVPEAYFREIDAILGDYRQAAEEMGAVILVVSDHGFLWGEGRPPRPDSLATATAGLWHRQDGIYVAWGRGIEPSAARGDGRVGQVTATILALLGLPRASGVGEPALAALTESPETRDYGPRSVAVPSPAPGVGAPSEEALERLRALGYLGTAESAARPEASDSGTRTAGSYNNEGLLLRDAGRNAEAQAAFEHALRLDPHTANAAHNLSVMLTDSDPARADALLLGALADGLGNGARIVVSAASAHRAKGDDARARRLIDGAIQRRPNDPGLRVLRGRLRIEARQCGPALEDFEAARQAVPEAPLPHALAGTAMLCLGRTAEGRAALERSLALDPSQTRLREQLSRMR